MPDTKPIQWGSLTKLRSKDVSTHLTMCDNTLVNDFILTTLRKTTKTGVYDVFEVNSKASIDSAIAQATVLPLNGDKWLLHVDVAKVRNHLPYFIENMTFGDTNIAWFETHTGRDFRAVIEAVRIDNVKWITWLTTTEMSMMLGKTDIEDKILNYFLRSYSNDIDAPLRLKRELEKGRKVTKNSDIQQLIGISIGTYWSLAIEFIWLGDTKITERSRKLHERSLVKAMLMLAEKVPVSKIKTQLYYTARDIYAVKMLYLTGEIYDYIPESVEGPYQDLKLKKYTKRIEKINSFPLFAHQRFYLEMKGVKGWATTTDMLDFLYRWFAISKVDDEHYCG